MGSVLVGVTSGTTGSADNIMAYSLFTSTNYSYTFTPTSTVTRRPSFRFVVNGTYDFTISNFEVKEVGISSSGFMPVTNEPVVPQVPLMRYNQVMLFDGTDDVVSTSGNSPLSGSNPFTMSAWINPFINPPDTSNDYMTFIKQGQTLANQMACFSIMRISGANHLGYLSHTNDFLNHIIPNNKWSHMSVTQQWNLLNWFKKIYLNGCENLDPLNMDL